MARVLLLGDSIRIRQGHPAPPRGYGEFAEKWLRKLGHDVVNPPISTMASKSLLIFWDRWAPSWGIDQNPPDIVHWNCGLSDIKRDPPDSDCLASIEEYERQLNQVYDMFRSKLNDPLLLWATTTPVILERQMKSETIRTLRRPEDATAYRMVGERVALEQGSPINDLASIVLEDVENNIAPDGIHISMDMCRRLGEAVTDFVHLHSASVG